MTTFAALSPLRDKLAADQEDLAEDLISNIDRFRVSAITTVELASEASDWLSRRMDALAAVMTDEERYPRRDRDQAWLDGAEEVLDLANSLALQVSRRRVQLRAAA